MARRFFSFLNNRSYIEAAPKADSIVPEKQNEAGGVGMKFAIYSRKSKATDKGWITESHQISECLSPRARLIRKKRLQECRRYNRYR